MDYLIRLLILLSSIVFILNASSNSENKELIVATKISPPFSFKNSKGEWEGVSIELWKNIAKSLNLKYKFQEESLESLLEKIKNKEVDIAIAALSVTANREKFADFTQSYYTTNLSIVIPKKNSSVLREVLNNIFSYEALFVILAIILIVIVAAFAYWLMERKSPEDKDSQLTFADSVWWASSTMTTVGYGNKKPKSVGGKIIAITWMFLSMFLIAGIIAMATSFLTRAQMDYFITKQSDLNKGQIGSIKESISDKYLRSRHIIPTYYNSIEDAVKAVEKGEIDAFVYDEAILRYISDRKYSKTTKLTDARFVPQNYSIILQEGSPLREKINRKLLEFIESPAWDEIKKRYFLKQ